MKKILMWGAALFALFVAYVVVANRLDGLSFAERWIAAIERFPWAETGKATGFIIVHWWLGEIAKLNFWIGLFS